MIPQPILTVEELENEIIELSKNKNNNQIRRYQFEQKLQKMIESLDIDIVTNGYIGFAHLAAMLDDDINTMCDYMNRLGAIIKNAHYYSAYSYFLFLFDELEEAKGKLLLALDYPITESEFGRITSMAILLQDNTIDEKILKKCKIFKGSDEYALIQMEVGENISSYFNKNDYEKIDLDDFFNDNKVLL